MNRMMLLGILAVVTVSLVAFAAQAQLFSKRPGALSTDVSFDPYHPVTFQVVINGQQLVERRSKRLGDTGNTPYSGFLQKTLDVEVNWIESFSQKAYSATVSVPVKSLSRIDAKNDHASLHLVIGQNGALQVATVHPDLNRYIREGREDDITPEMDALVQLNQVCGTEIAKGAQRYGEMRAWLDDFSMRAAEKARSEALARDPNGQSPDPCGSGG